MFLVTKSLPAQAVILTPPILTKAYYFFFFLDLAFFFDLDLGPQPQALHMSFASFA